MVKKKKKGRSVKRNPNVNIEPEELVNAPHSFIIHRGFSTGHILELTRDFRKVMDPFTAKSLQEKKSNTIKDFVAVSGLLHVTHLCIFSQTEIGMYFKVARLPRGPTLTFKIHEFSLAKDVVSSLKKQMVIEKAFRNSPLIILNGFNVQNTHMKLLASMFQNMFPKINLTNVVLNNIRRCVLMNYNPSTELIDFRHYIIKVTPVGVSRGVKKVIQGKIPNLSRCNDISEFFIKSGLMSESEIEDDPNTHVTVSQKLASRGNIEQGQSAIRLTELGPRITLQLMKIEDGLLDGIVLYHNLIHKTEEEKLLTQKKREAKKKLKETRKHVQEANKKRKETEKEEHKQKSLRGMRNISDEKESELLNINEDDDDANYYREEIGEEPDKDLFNFQPSKSNDKMSKPFKKFNKKPKPTDDKKQNFKKDFKSFKKNKFSSVKGDRDRSKTRLRTHKPLKKKTKFMKRNRR